MVKGSVTKVFENANDSPNSKFNINCFSNEFCLPISLSLPDKKKRN